MLNSKNQVRIEADTNASWIQASALGYLVLIVFVSWKALDERGYLGILGLAFSTWAGSQVFLDLVIALSIASLWIYQDARRTGRKWIPWVFASIFLGSIPLLFYILKGRFHRSSH